MNYIKSLLFFLAITTSTLCFGQIKLPRLISDGAILQRDTEINVWGWASPNEKIAMTLNGEDYQTTASNEGHWTIKVPPHKAGGPYQVKLSGKNEIVLENILFGDVWVCSGQSNMELTMDRVKDKYPSEMSRANNPNIRQFLVPDNYDFSKEFDDLDDGNWVEVNENSIAQFSAVAYFFAKDLYENHQVPIGLINSALGGSPVESWMSEDALKKFPYAYNELLQYRNQSYIDSIEKSDRDRHANWYAKINRNDLGVKENWKEETIEDSDWKTMEIPGFWAQTELGKVNGSVWFRKSIEIPESMTGKEAALWLGRIVDRDSVFVNGQFVGATSYQYPPRKYRVPKGILKAGKNIISIRVINEQGLGGFVKDKPYFLAIEKDTLDLKSFWSYKLGTNMLPLQGPTFIRWKAGGLYNRMIAPLLNYKIKGAIWYQGESNTKNPSIYSDAFSTMIEDWRAKWNSGNFPFIFVQLANFMSESKEPSESSWAELRQAQLETLEVPNTGMAVIIDIGEWNDIHPLNKKDVGHRLALQAEKLAYGNTATNLTSPLPETVTFGENDVTVTFKNCGNGLISKDSDWVSYFEISNDGVHFVKAKAKIIDSNKVRVWAKTIKNPLVVRYAWADNPKTANLFSEDGLPASPFQVKKKK